MNTMSVPRERRSAVSAESGAHVAQPPLRLLHSDTILSKVKLDQFRRLSTAELIESLRPGTPGALKARPDGTVLAGTTESWYCANGMLAWTPFRERCCLKS